MSSRAPIAVGLCLLLAAFPLAASASLYGPRDCSWNSDDFESVSVGTGSGSCGFGDVSFVYCDPDSGFGVGGGTFGVGQAQPNVGAGTSEECRPECNDDVDNDGDGAVDFPADPGCDHADDDNEVGILACDNGLDDDNDGLSDYRIDASGDPGCTGPGDSSERGTIACDNGLDDDADGRIDYHVVPASGDPGCTGPTDNDEYNAPLELVINEIDYDNIGTDASEFVEVFNAGAATASLAGIALVFVNGGASPPSEYMRVDLSSAGTLAPGEFLLVGAPSMDPGGGVAFIALPLATNAIQNGGPDGVAIFDTLTSTLVDALSYEGAITAATIVDAPGTYNLVEGTPFGGVDSNTASMSFARIPNGMDSDNAATDWTTTGSPTPGATNQP